MQLTGLVGQFKLRRRLANSNFFSGRNAGSAAQGRKKDELD
jgi:hypothetical protein